MHHKITERNAISWQVKTPIYRIDLFNY